VDKEKERLIARGREDLAARFFHTAAEEGDGAGYDVKSFDVAGNVKYIEVKTTTGPADTDFYVTENELAFSDRVDEKYALYRLYSFSVTGNSAQYYELRGPLTRHFALLPVQYRVKR